MVESENGNFDISRGWESKMLVNISAKRMIEYFLISSSEE
jgi:hypothetical protein